MPLYRRGRSTLSIYRQESTFETLVWTGGEHWMCSVVPPHAKTSNRTHIRDIMRSSRDSPPIVSVRAVSDTSCCFGPTTYL